MNIQRWIARREPNWQRLDALLTVAEQKGIARLNAGEIREMASLYRSVSADLARARTHQIGEVIVKNLQSLTSRSYTQVYQGSRRQDWRNVRDFYRWELPQVIQQTWVYTAIATGIFLLGGLIAWWYSWQDPQFMSLIIPESMISQVRDRRELWMGSIIGIEPAASSNIMVNNIRVSFNVVAGGISAGILTFIILFVNGLLIGAVATLVHQNSLAYPFWAFVFPHGSLELPAIFLAGGAGLLIARALLFPGRFRRVDALKFYGNLATKLVFGIVPMLFIAGIIEGFFSPSPAIPSTFKYLVGIGLFIALMRYILQRSNQSIKVDF